ncbi:MAG: carbohydrate ABC transporter permease [Candidatus Ornithospirochaeta sp.]|nr:carbohydrate ABC transporter permease [Candidatus Ornithospirochaeta sp.]
MATRKIRKTREDYIIDFIVYAFVLILTISIVLPFMQVITVSMSPARVVNKNGFHLIPTAFDFSGYQKILGDKDFLRSYWTTIKRAIIGTASCVLMTVLTAYPISKRNLPHRKGIMLFIIFTMYFSGGMIPNYLLIKKLGLINRFSVFILPMLITGYALIVTRNYFMTIPDAIEESAKIDGANDLVILFKLYLPLATPVIATIALWYCVQHWNAWMDCMLYITKREKYTLQYLLQTIIASGQTDDVEQVGMIVHTETMKMAALVLSLIPIVCSYPFLQRYFIKGMVVGAVKQ